MSKESMRKMTAKHPVKAPGLQTIMSYVLPKRTENEVYLHQAIDITELLKYIDKKNLEHPERKLTLFHCAVTAITRMVNERPKMNRFIQGWKMYERENISLAFVVKRKFDDHAEESLMVLLPDGADNVDSISGKIIGDVKEIRRATSTGGIDAIIDKLAAIPRPFLALIIRIIRLLDFWGKNLPSLMDGDPNYSSVFLSNLGSIQCPAVYHHLNNYGTNSIMVTIGTMYKAKTLMPDGTEEIRDFVDFGATLDERIADGFYFGRSLKLLQHVFKNPELLDLPIEEHSGYEYK